MKLHLLAPVVLLAACSVQDHSLRDRAAARHLCDDRPAQQYVGQTISEELGRAVLASTGAGFLEWVAPEKIVDVAYSPGRVRVTHDAEMKVVEIRCG